jgi:hypothetical protein
MIPVADLSRLVSELSNLTIVEAAELAKRLEERWEFINEERLDTFEGFLKYQVVDATTTAPEVLKMWRDLYEAGQKRNLVTPKVGLMRLLPVPGEHRYAVALRDGNDLWLTLWVRRSPKGEFFIMMPRGDRDWDVHTSYHLDGTLHMKSFGRTGLQPQKRQPLTGSFHGTEHLGGYYGHAPKSVGAVCDPAAFSGILELPPGVLGPSKGAVTVDLVEPGHEPTGFPWKSVAKRQVFDDFLPNVVITVGS